MSFQTGTFTDLLFSNFADHTALSSFTSEASLLAGTNEQPAFSDTLFDRAGGVRNRSIGIKARGVLSCTGTPTYLFTVRIGSTAGSSDLSGTPVSVTAAITCASGITNKFWELNLDLTIRTPGLGSNNCTVAGAGHVISPGGFAAPYMYALEPTTPDTATWTATINGAVKNYLNISCTCSASSSSNAITLKDLLVWAWN